MLYIFEDVRLTKGSARSVITDLSRGNYHFIPNYLYDILIESNGVYNIQEIKNKFFKKDLDLFNEYFDFLIKNDYIIDIPNELRGNFPKMKFYFEYPFVLENIYFVVTKSNIPKIINLFKEEIVDITKNYTYLISNEVTKKEIIGLLDVVTTCTVAYHKLIMNKTVNIDYKLVEILSFEENIDDAFFEKKTLRETFPKFHNNIVLYTEATNHHTFFNRSVFINSKGLILGHYADKSNYGSIYKVSKEQFIEIIQNENIQKFWNIPKNTVSVCKDCELRMMCIDLRIPCSYDGILYTHKEECSYNPYIAKWKKEKGYLSIEELGHFDVNHIFVPDYSKINEINKKIWKN